jgi:SAM-dependent methyltransferase
MALSRPRHAASALAGRTVDALPSGTRRRVRAALGRPGPRQVSFDELDAELDRATALMASAPDEAHALLQSFVLALPSSPPSNPFSDAYREWTWELYRRISGRDSYDTSHEASPFDFALALERPFPYQSGSLAMVGRDLAARGHLLRCLADLDPRRVVEFGPGWGNITADMVATGLDVTAVEVDESFCRLVAERVRGPGHLSVEQADMLTFFAGKRYDAAVFYESFHHCADHMAMLRHLHGIVRPEGAVFFAAEPVQRLEYPWGPRLDGLSVWSSRTHGWLELGFDERYFLEALVRTGWRGERHLAGARPGETDVIVARSAFSVGESDTDTGKDKDKDKGKDKGKDTD